MTQLGQTRSFDCFTVEPLDSQHHLWEHTLSVGAKSPEESDVRGTRGVWEPAQPHAPAGPAAPGTKACLQLCVSHFVIISHFFISTGLRSSFLPSSIKQFY